MVSNLRPIGPALEGIGSMSSLIDQHLFDNSGRRRDFQVLRDELGDMEAHQIVLEYELRRRLRAPRARGYPPRVFISYRRETPDHIHWCRRLAEALDRAGYRVFLDEFAWTEDVTSEGISFFIGRLALADVAVLVLTDEYAPQAAEQTGLIGMRYWLYEEWSRINILRDWGLIEIVAVWRSGTFPGEHGTSHGPIVQVNNTLDAVIDATSDNEGLQNVLRFFGKYEGPKYDGQELRTLADSSAAVVKACVDRDISAASGHLHKIERFSDTEEYQLALAHWITAFQDKEEGARKALSILERKPGIPTCYQISELLWLHDFDVPALALFSRIADSPSLWRHRARFLVADILSRLQALDSAANNLSWTLQSNAEQLGGYWSQFSDETKVNLGKQLANMKAAAANRHTWVAEACKLFGISTQSPQKMWPTPSRKCEFCTAAFPAEGYVCVLCGGIQRFKFDRCPYCAQADVAAQLKDIQFCPICKLLRNGLGSTMTIHFTFRRTGKEFSVLKSDFEAAIYGGPLKSQSPVTDC